MGRQKGAKEHSWTKKQVRWAYEAKQNGWNWHEIGKVLGVSGNSVYQVVKRNYSI